MLSRILERLLFFFHFFDSLLPFNVPIREVRALFIVLFFDNSTFLRFTWLFDYFFRGSSIRVRPSRQHLLGFGKYSKSMGKSDSDRVVIFGIAITSLYLYAYMVLDVFQVQYHPVNFNTINLFDCWDSSCGSCTLLPLQVESQDLYLLQ